MSDEDALLCAIYANPDDDTPRLVYADWLDEHGDAERAELIRLQVRGARSREPDEEAWARCRRLRELFEGGDAPRKRELCPCGDLKKVEIDFERGFPVGLTLTDPTVNEFALLTHLPMVRQLSVQGRCELTPFVLELIADLRCLDVLYVWDAPVSAEALDAFERLPPWTVFFFFCFEVGRGDETAMRAFKARRLARFEQLSAGDRRAGAIRSLRIFLHGQCPPRPNELVKTLRVAHVTYPFSGDEDLFRYAAITELEQLHLDGVGVTTEGLRHLARLPNLKGLKIEQCPIDSLEPLAACPGLTDLAVDFYSVVEQYGISALGDAGTTGLEQLTNLRRLSLTWCGIGGETLLRLAGLRHLRHLELDLMGAARSVHKSEVSTLAGLTELEHLNLRMWLWTPDLQYIEALHNLQTLTLYILGGSEGELRRLAGLTKLQSLTLCGKGVTEEVIRKLVWLENLRTLELRDTEVSEGGACVLAHRMPDLAITLDGNAVSVNG
jgi:uncharacterized protein (TIGR02996 family)